MKEDLDIKLEIKEYEDIQGYSGKDLKYIVLIIYDIVDNNHRLKVSKYLSKFGNRVQKSAFEAKLTKSKYTKMIQGLESLMLKEDNIRVYKLYGEQEVRTYGSVSYEDLDDFVII